MANKSDGFCGPNVRKWRVFGGQTWDFVVINDIKHHFLLVKHQFFWWLDMISVQFQHEFLALSHCPIIPLPCLCCSSRWLQQAMKRWFLRENLRISRDAIGIHGKPRSWFQTCSNTCFRFIPNRKNVLTHNIFDNMDMGQNPSNLLFFTPLHSWDLWMFSPPINIQ